MVSVTIVSTNRRRIMIIGGIVLLLIFAGASGVFVRWLQTKDGTGGDDTSLTGRQSSGFSKEIDELQSLRAAGYTDAVNQKIEKALKDPLLPKADQYQLYIQQGNAFIDKQDYKAAIAAYEKAEAIDPTYTIMSTLARTWMEAGDKAKAIEYYKKTLPLVPAGPIQDDNKASIEKIIQNLEAQP